MDETLAIDPHRSAEVWDHEGKVHLALNEDRYGRVQVSMTPMQARMLAQMLQEACPEDAFADPAEKPV